jgi:hypothetical protein
LQKVILKCFHIISIEEFIFGVGLLKHVKRLIAIIAISDFEFQICFRIDLLPVRKQVRVEQRTVNTIEVKLKENK